MITAPFDSQPLNPLKQSQETAMKTVIKPVTKSTRKAILLHTSALLLTIAGCGAHAQQAVDESREVTANERIEIEAMRGDVQIRTTDSTTFRISGTLDEEAEGYTLESSGGFTRFEVEMPRRPLGGPWNDSDGGSRLTIVVPHGSEIEFRGVNSAVDIADVSGRSSINTVNGSITAANLSNVVSLSTVNGSIASTGNSGRVEINSVNGEVDDSDSSGRVEYSTVNGDLRIDTRAEEVQLSTINGEAEASLQGTTDLHLSTVNGDIDISLTGSPSPRIDGSTVSGDLRLLLEPQIGAKFSLKTNAGGSIQNNLSSDEVQREQYGPARRLNFSLGDGSGSVELNTVSGQLVLDQP